MPEVTEIGRKYSHIQYDTGRESVADLEAGVGVPTVSSDGKQIRTNKEAKQRIRELR